MATKELTKQEEYERILKSLEINEHRLNVITRRIPELEAELQAAVVKQEIKGYAANTIKRLQDELKHLQSEKNNLEFSISAMQKALPEVKRQAEIERTATEGIEGYQKTKKDINTVLSEMPSLEAFESLTDSLIIWVDKLHECKAKFFSEGKNLYEFLDSNKIRELNGITQNTIRQDRQAVTFSPVIRLCHEIEKVIDLLTEVKISLYSADTDNNRNTQLPPPLDIDRDYPELSPCGKYKRVRYGENWYLFRNGEFLWHECYRGFPFPLFPDPEDPEKRIKSMPVKDITQWLDYEFCDCGKHLAAFDGKAWYLYELVKDPMPEDNNQSKVRRLINIYEEKIVFQCAAVA